MVKTQHIFSKAVRPGSQFPVATGLCLHCKRSCDDQDLTLRCYGALGFHYDIVFREEDEKQAEGPVQQKEDVKPVEETKKE
jgi:hypothetical protein